jgi:hypothetical protein
MGTRRFRICRKLSRVDRRYRGLRFGELINITENDAGLLVRSEVATLQIDEKRKTAALTDFKTDDTTVPQTDLVLSNNKPKRYHGTVALDSARVVRDAGKIAEEIVTHLVGLVGSSVCVTLEIDAKIPEGVADNVVRIVTENSRTLKFTSSGFETD